MKIVCPYDESHEFYDLGAAFHCYDCFPGCPLVDNVLHPVFSDLISRLETLLEDNE